METYETEIFVEVIFEGYTWSEKYTFVQVMIVISSYFTRNDIIFIHFLLKNRKMNTREPIISTVNVVYLRFDVSMDILT